MTKFGIYFKSNFDLIIAALVTGFLVGTSYVPFPAWAICFCYIPLWWSVHKAEAFGQNLKSIFFLGWISQFVLTLIGFNWLYYTAREFGELPVIISILTLLLFATFMHVYIPLALVIAVWMKRKFSFSQKWLIFLLALVHIFIERVWPSIFEWNLGYTLFWMNWPIYQWADTIGFWGLSSLIFVLNAILYFAIMNYTDNKRQSVIVALVTISFIALFSFLGLKKQLYWQETTSKMSVAIVQASISNDAKIAAEKGLNYHNFIIDKYLATTNSLFNQPNRSNEPVDFIVWPETAMPLPLDDIYLKRLSQQSLLESISTWKSTLITGGYSLDSIKKDFHGRNTVRNSVFFLSPTGTVASPYFKTQLLVFGESMPLGETFPILYKWLPFVGTYEKGPGPVLRKLSLKSGDEIQVGPQICYESLDPHFSRKLTSLGAQVILNVTNDSWFGNWAEPLQHMIMTLARGVENRRPLIRSTNTGVSTVVKADGTILTRSPIDQVWGYVYNLNLNLKPELSFYTRFGAWDLNIYGLLLIFVIWRGKGKNVKKS